MNRPTFLSLFAGIGGLDLGLERAGWRCVGQVEIDPFCQRVLAKHWPEVPRWGDIKELHADELPRADLIAGGFPCQPVSVAGRGLAQADERWLWPEAARLVRHLRPRWVLLENVSGLLARGMGDVLGDLAACGYDARWDCVPASAVGAPHQRDRVWVVAYPSPSGWGTAECDLPQGQSDTAGSSAVPDPERVKLRDEPGRRNGQGRPGQAVAGDDGAAWPVADTDGIGRFPGQHDTRQPEVAEPLHRGMGYPDGQGRHQRPRIFGRGRGRPQPPHDGWWDVEPDVGRVAHGIPNRVDRLRSLGNAVVPQVAEHVGRLILQAHLSRAGARAADSGPPTSSSPAAPGGAGAPGGVAGAPALDAQSEVEVSRTARTAAPHTRGSTTSASDPRPSRWRPLNVDEDRDDVRVLPDIHNHETVPVKEGVL